MHSGDILLVQGAWHDISRLDGEPSEWVVLGQPLAEASRVTLDYKAPLAAAIMVLMIACMMFDFIPIAPGHGRDDRRRADGADRLPAQRGSRLQNDQLGKASY